MGENLTRKIIADHLVSGEMTAGSEISIRIDQTLTQDSTGTMAYLQFEALGVPRVRTERSVAYIDHNTLQAGPENADDHRYIRSVAKKYGIVFSKPGNGICHQVHLERFGIPGKTLLGSDSHTPTSGGIGMLAIGAGGLDVAVAMGGGAYYLVMPRVIQVYLTGKLQPFVSSKDIILSVLRLLGVKGGVGKVLEYCGPGVDTLTVPERATITNMGAELGATTSIFPSDAQTQAFLKAQGREQDFSELLPDTDATYDERVKLDLNTLEPMAACPHSPDNVVPVSQLRDIAVQQVAIGSCTNSSYTDMMKTAAILKDNSIKEDVSLVVSPGSKQVMAMLSGNGALKDLLDAGARILECACGPCIGMGQAPETGAVSLRTFNRNFEGRSGTRSAQVYLVSPETAAMSALTGKITDPRLCKRKLDVEMPEQFAMRDNLLVQPAAQGSTVNIVRGPNIKPFPVNTPLTDMLSGSVILKMGDNITTDHIMPSNARLLPYRSNIPYLSDYCLTPVDEGFPKRAREMGGGILIAGHNYGQGSSREHAALVPLYLGVKAVIAKSFARIHMANLINSGILPLTFLNESDYDAIQMDDVLEIQDAGGQVLSGGEIHITNTKNMQSYALKLDVSGRLRKILCAGGLLNYTKQSQA